MLVLQSPEHSLCAWRAKKSLHAQKQELVWAAGGAGDVHLQVAPLPGADPPGLRLKCFLLFLQHAPSQLLCCSSIRPFYFCNWCWKCVSSCTRDTSDFYRDSMKHATSDSTRFCWKLFVSRLWFAPKSLGVTWASCGAGNKCSSALNVESDLNYLSGTGKPQ